MLHSKKLELGHLESPARYYSDVQVFRFGARSLRVVPNVSLRRCAFQIRWHNSQQQLDAVMSSPVSKAKQPSIHAFFAGASVKKPAASVQGGAGRVEKAKTAQEQLKTEKKKRSAPGGEADDGKKALQVQFTCG